MSPNLGISGTAANGSGTVDWGDGSADTPFAGPGQYGHAYPAAGDYTAVVRAWNGLTESITITISATPPNLASITPQGATTTDPDGPLNCNGTFDGAQAIYFNHVRMATTYGANPLTDCSTTIHPSEFATGASFPVYVENGDGSRSNGVWFSFQ